MDRTEDELIAAIRKVIAGDDPGVAVGVGDDAAVVDPGRNHTVLTADVLVEGVHFDLETMAPHDLGYKALVVNLSDVAAMGGSPRYALVSLVLPPAVEPPWVMELYGGIREAADEHGTTVVGGDLSRGERVVVAVALAGSVGKDRAVVRSGARPGDVLAVTGTLGGAAGGLRLSQAPPHGVRGPLASDWGRALVAAYLRPAARVGEGETLAHAGATAMMDLSDGLALDLSRMCAESGVGARVRLHDVPVAPGLEPLAGELGIEPVDLALHGGEDYELLVALPQEIVASVTEKIDERFGTRLTTIGEMVEDPGIVVVAADGTERPLPPRGWDHFA
ncbi:MAG: thiamine-phosphate kinase [Actinomycetota bacterium]|nr:thiamine-phosphate kinase [Actinomycetota bacterium]